MKKTAVIIGDSFPNTLGLIWSLGEVCVPMILVLVATVDNTRVLKSRYLKNNTAYQVATIDEVLPLLENIKNKEGEKIIICTNDRAAEYIDAHEEYLNQYFTTPCRGGHIGKYFNKASQCDLAMECGLDVPKSMIFNREDNISDIVLKYPILTKPLYSTEGEKDDIHICKSPKELKVALKAESRCQEFIIQEYIEKEFELNVQGVCCENGIFYGGAIRKIRHFPETIGAASFAKVEDCHQYNINTEAISEFIKKVNYRGPFSCEFLHKGEHNYFMEINLRNDGLGYAATRDGTNLPSLLFENTLMKSSKSRGTYMMWLNNERQNIKTGYITWAKWFMQFLKTSCFIDYNKHDLMPAVWRYLDKFQRICKKA